MNLDFIKKTLESLQKGHLSLEEAIRELKNLPYQDLGFAKLDHHRQLRRGFSEAVYCPGKSIEHIIRISQNIINQGLPLLATKANETIYKAILEIEPLAQFYPDARMVVVQKIKPDLKGHIMIVSAGTADIPIAQEAAITGMVYGSKVTTLFDVGVSGIHRLFDAQHLFDQAAVIVVVAGMEGALASVVAGLVSKPVIAVPTSIGYGASFGGLSALLTMLNSCAGGVAVVNIDNGYSAGCIAHLINTSREN